MSPRNPASRRRATHLWILASAKPDGAAMSDHLDGLQQVIQPRRNALRELGDAVSIELFLGWSQSSSQGCFTIEREFVSLLGEIGASVVLNIHGD